MMINMGIKRYIRCVYCGTILGEARDFDEHPSSAYCIGCFANSKGWTEEDGVEILKEWER